MEAIKLMQMRDQYKSNLRREMATSMMLEKKIHPLIHDLSQEIPGIEAQMNR